MLKNLLKQVLYYGKNGLKAVGGAEIATYALCGTLVFCFLCGAAMLSRARRNASPDELTKAMQKNALALRVFRLQAKLLFLLLAAVCGLDFLYEKEVFEALPVAAAFFTLYGVAAVGLCLVFTAFVRAANKRAQLRYKIARLAEERRLMSLRDIRLFSEISRLERTLALSAETKRRFEPMHVTPNAVSSPVKPKEALTYVTPSVTVNGFTSNGEPKPSAPKSPAPVEPMPTAPVEEPLPNALPQAEPFAPTPYAEPPKREGEMPETARPLRRECEKQNQSASQAAQPFKTAQAVLPFKTEQKPCKNAPQEQAPFQSAAREACKKAPLVGISHAKIGDLLQKLSTLPLSEGDALAAKKIELCLKEALLSGGTPQQVSSQLAALLKILARYEAV